ncbi:MAG: tetratricopeptide repeat protein [Actinomycetota bacterium]|nr:tetratricopeptide repeat protein [Actinomycetota bacterium]
MGLVVFKISVGFVTGALILLAISLYLSSRYLDEQLRLAETGNLEGARDEIQRAARLDPFSPVPPTSEAYLELRQGRTEAAAEAFQEAIDRDPANYNNWVALGDLQRQRLGDPAAAARNYREALSRNPHATAVVSRFAETLLRTEEPEEARAQYEWLRERGQISFTDLYRLGKLQVLLGEPEEAVGTFGEAKKSASAGLESLSESQRAERETFIESLDLASADALIAQGSYAEAREVLSQSEAEQAPAVLALLDEAPESYRRSVLDAPIS